MDRTSEIRKVLIITLLLNVAVSSAKLAYGYMTSSIAIVSDGYHSLFDGVSNIVGLIGNYIASHPPDAEHPYGHRKYETVFTIFIGVMMFATCFEIFSKVYRSLSEGSVAKIAPESFAVMAVTMAVNIFVTLYEKRKGEELGSEYLIADSQHTKSDVFASVAVIGGLAFTMMGYPLADPVIGGIVGLLVARAGARIIMEATEALVDSTRQDTMKIKEVACSIDGVVECHEIRTRGTKSHVFLDLHVLVDPSLTVREAHEIATLVEEEIKSRLPEVVDIIVHIEPSKSGESIPGGKQE